MVQHLVYYIIFASHWFYFSMTVHRCHMSIKSKGENRCMYQSIYYCTDCQFSDRRGIEPETFCLNRINPWLWWNKDHIPYGEKIEENVLVWKSTTQKKDRECSQQCFLKLSRISLVFFDLSPMVKWLYLNRECKCFSFSTYVLPSVLW